jgi:pimeloyl-ACP methyl ester carboxylesterase
MTDELSSEPKSAFVNAGDVRLHYLEWNADPSANDTDAIPLVMLHGLAATA